LAHYTADAVVVKDIKKLFRAQFSALARWCPLAYTIAC
jgi:hypothetical protein